MVRLNGAASKEVAPFFMLHPERDRGVVQGLRTLAKARMADWLT